jgi:hypothetical protein
VRVQAGIRPGGTLAELAAEFPGWHVWRGRDGRGADQEWFATGRRRVAAAEAEAAAGLAAALSAGNAVSLHGMLAQQRVIEERAAGAVP